MFISKILQQSPHIRAGVLLVIRNSLFLTIVRSERLQSHCMIKTTPAFIETIQELTVQSS